MEKSITATDAERAGGKSSEIVPKFLFELSRPACSLRYLLYLIDLGLQIESMRKKERSKLASPG